LISIKESATNRFIYILLAGAFLLRFPGIFDGLPAVYNSTEYFLSKIALNMGVRYSLDPLNYIYPSLYSYILILIYGCYYLLGSLYGAFENTYAFALQFLTNPSGFYIITRSINVLISLATVWMIYIFLRKYKDEFLARIAALIATVNLHLIQFSTYGTADTLLVFFSTLSVLLIYKLYHAPHSGNFFLAGLFCGLAIATKYNAGFLILGIFVAQFQIWKIRKTAYIRSGLCALVGILIGFFATNPYWLLKTQKFIEGFQIISQQMYSAVSLEHGINYIWEIMAIIKDELLLGVLFIIATLFMIWKEGKRQLPFIVIVLATFLYVASWRKKGIDYLFAIFPICFIFSAIFIKYIVDKIVKEPRIKMYILLILFLPSILIACYHVILTVRNDTRELATIWLMSNLQKNDHICYDNTHYDLGLFDVDRYISYGKGATYLPLKVKEDLETFRDHDRNVSFIPILFEGSTRVLSAANEYELQLAKYQRKTLNQLFDDKVDYLIINSNFYSPYLEQSAQRFSPFIQKRIQDIQNFYQYLFNKFEPHMDFRSSFWTKGPDLYIYHFNTMSTGVSEIEN
jgi:hypothetical protein